MVRELSQWLGKEILVGADRDGSSRIMDVRDLQGGVASCHYPPCCERHWVTFELAESKARRSEPIEKLMLSWADQENRLLVLVKPERRREMAVSPSSFAMASGDVKLRRATMSNTNVQRQITHAPVTLFLGAVPANLRQDAHGGIH